LDDNSENSWFFSSTAEGQFGFGCLIWKWALFWVLLGFIAMIEIDR